MWTAIIGAIIAVVQACTTLAESAIKNSNAALTARRELIAKNLSEFFQMKTTNYKDVVLAVIALVGLFGIIYILKIKK